MSRALGHIFGQRRRYAILGAITYRGPLPAGGIAILVRTPTFVVRRDLATLQRAGLVDASERRPRYRLAHQYANPEAHHAAA